MLTSGNQVSHLIGPNGACPNVPDETESNVWIIIAVAMDQSKRLKMILVGSFLPLEHFLPFAQLFGK